MRADAAALLLVFAGAAAVSAAPECMVPTGEYLPTQVPYTHILDRSDVFAEDYLDQLKVGPPYLLENGMIQPTHQYFGPMCDLDALRRGEPGPSVQEFVQQYREKAEATREYVKQAKARGVQLVTAYICMNTIGGDPEKRTGFWHFYDNWDTFSEFQIPPRPPDDPETWQQLKADGSPFIAYTRAHLPYKPMFRWTNCINNPSWRTYQQWVTEEAARAGIDGFFVDNAGTQRCYCKHCQTKFAEWLKSRYTEEEIEELLGGDLSMSLDEDEHADLRKAEVQLFRQESIHDFLADVRRWGSDIHGSFFVFPNGLHRRSHFIGTRFRDCDLAMDENSVGTVGTHPGVAHMHIIAGLHIKHVNDNLVTFKYAAGTGARCRANLLCRSGYPKSDPANLGPNANVGALGIAEAAAFGGGGCYLHRGTKAHPWLAPVRANYNEFFEANADDYRGKYPFGQVGIIAFVLPNYFGDRSAFNGVDQALHVLAAQHILADLIPERVFTPAWISRYAALVMPYMPIVSDSQIAVLTDYVKQGGKLILLGKEVASRDRFGRDRDPQAAGQLLDAATARYDWDLAQAFAEGAPLSGLELCGKQATPLVRLSAYVDDPHEPTELVLHCVNYDVDLGLDHHRVGAISNLDLSVPLPANTRATSAVFKAPGEADVGLKVENGEGRAVAAGSDRERSPGRARLTIPELRIYGFVHISLQRAGA